MSPENKNNNTRFQNRSITIFRRYIISLYNIVFYILITFDPKCHLHLHFYNFACISNTDYVRRQGIIVWNWTLCFGYLYKITYKEFKHVGIKVDVKFVKLIRTWAFFVVRLRLKFFYVKMETATKKLMEFERILEFWCWQ